MTDKQIIIDGVNVSECEYYNKDDKTCREINGNYDTDICEFDKCENYNCYYKQLQREKQNSQEAIDASIREFNRAEELKTLLKRKEQEYNKLKQALAKIKKICSEMNCESLMQNSWCGNTDFKMGCCEKVFKRQLLQVINEVIE